MQERPLGNQSSPKEKQSLLRNNILMLFGRNLSFFQNFLSLLWKKLKSPVPSSSILGWFGVSIWFRNSLPSFRLSEGVAHSSTAQPHFAHSNLPSWLHAPQGLPQEWTAVGPTLHRDMGVCPQEERVLIL